MVANTDREDDENENLTRGLASHKFYGKLRKQHELSGWIDPEGEGKHFDIFGSARAFSNKSLTKALEKLFYDQSMFGYKDSPRIRKNLEATRTVIHRQNEAFKDLDRANGCTVAGGLSIDMEIAPYDGRDSCKANNKYIRCVSRAKAEFVGTALPSKCHYGEERWVYGKESLHAWAIDRRELIETFVWYGASEKTMSLDERRLKAVSYQHRTTSEFPYIYTRSEVIPFKNAGGSDWVEPCDGMYFASLHRNRVVDTTENFRPNIDSMAEDSPVTVLRGRGISICRYFLGWSGNDGPNLFEDQLRLNLCEETGEVLGQIISRANLDELCEDFRKCCPAISARLFFETP